MHNHKHMVYSERAVEAIKIFELVLKSPPKIKIIHLPNL